MNRRTGVVELAAIDENQRVDIGRVMVIVATVVIAVFGIAVAYYLGERLWRFARGHTARLRPRNPAWATMPMWGQTVVVVGGAVLVGFLAIGCAVGALH